jgi:ubiquinol-cytochrome c reductase cytochrome c1 subunit
MTTRFTMNGLGAALRAAALAALLGLISAGDAARAAGEILEPMEVDWSFEGPFGTFDPGQLQRGFAVYKEVCASCHSMSLLAIRNLAEEGGPGFTPEQVKVIASEYTVVDGPDDTGEMFERPGVPADRFPAPFPNEAAARAAMGGSYPPDLSVLAKAREGGADYIYSILVGYHEPPPDFELAPGQYYNPYFPGAQIAMPPPLGDGGIGYPDGAPETVEQYAADVSAFLMWAAEPKLMQRKSTGFVVITFLVILTILLWLTKRKIWGRLDDH